MESTLSTLSTARPKAFARLVERGLWPEGAAVNAWQSPGMAYSGYFRMMPMERNILKVSCVECRNFADVF